MKKQLLSTSAIALGVAMAAPASAQEWNLDWGGFFNTHVAYASVDSDTAAQVGADFDGVDVFVNREIHFTPSVTLDNGLTFGVNVQFEADNSSAPNSNVDETFMTISSDTLGRIILGNENSAGYLLSVGAPQVAGGIGINSPSSSAYIPLSIGGGGNLPWRFRDSGISSYTEVVGNNDVPRITYFTPSFNGLTLGVSYAVAADRAGGLGANAANNGPINRNVGVTDIFDIGLAYSQSFNGIDLDLSARWGTAENNTGAGDDPEVWAVGANIGFNGWTFGGSYGENDHGGLNAGGGAPGAYDSEGWSLGVTYDIAGPWSVGFDTYQGEYSGVGAASGDKAEYEAYQLVGSRELGSGVTWGVYAAYVQGTVNADLGGTFGNANTEVDGTVVGTSISLSF